MKNLTKKLTVALFNLCLILLALIIPALCFVSSESFYRATLNSCGMYAKIDPDGTEHRRIIYYVGGDRECAATISNEGIDTVVSHIVDYLSGDKESFELTLDGVYVIGEGIVDGVSLFGEKAISHMEDVKELIAAAKWVVGICSLTLLGLIAYFILKREKMKKLLFKYSLTFYGVLLFAIALFLLVTLITSTKSVPFPLRLWKNLHFIIFPFQPGKVRDSELSDALTSILTTSFFMTAVIYVLAFAALAVLCWLFVSYRLAVRKSNSYGLKK